MATCCTLCPQVKSYLAGNPPIKIKLNDDLLITRRDGSSGPGFGGSGGYGGGFSSGDYAADSLVILEDANFHEVRSAVRDGRVCSRVPLLVLTSQRGRQAGRQDVVGWGTRACARRRRRRGFCAESFGCAVCMC